MRIRPGGMVVAAIAVAVVAVPVVLLDRPECGEVDALACPPPELANGLGRVLDRREVCSGAGYLCLGRRDFQVMRWPLARGRLRVRVPRPDVEPGSVARALQEAAVAGVMQWDGHPFPLDVDDGPFPLRPWDIELYWVPRRSFSAGGAGATGVTVAEWEERGGELSYRVRSISTVMYQSDGEGGQIPATPQLAEHVAAHEMAHALGVFHHSDRDTDVLAPASTLLPRVSARDLATMEALYRLPNGAHVPAR